MNGFQTIHESWCVTFGLEGQTHPNGSCSWPSEEKQNKIDVWSSPGIQITQSIPPGYNVNYMLPTLFWVIDNDIVICYVSSICKAAHILKVTHVVGYIVESRQS